MSADPIRKARGHKERASWPEPAKVLYVPKARRRPSRLERLYDALLRLVRA